MFRLVANAPEAALCANFLGQLRNRIRNCPHLWQPYGDPSFAGFVDVGVFSHRIRDAHHLLDPWG